MNWTKQRGSGLTLILWIIGILIVVSIGSCIWSGLKPKLPGARVTMVNIQTTTKTIQNGQTETINVYVLFDRPAPADQTFTLELWDDDGSADDRIGSPRKFTLKKGRSGARVQMPVACNDKGELHGDSNYDTKSLDKNDKTDSKDDDDSWDDIYEVYAYIADDGSGEHLSLEEDDTASIKCTAPVEENESEQE
jgi:hypothetical protein